MCLEDTTKKNENKFVLILCGNTGTIHCQRERGRQNFNLFILVEYIHLFNKLCNDFKVNKLLNKFLRYS